MKRNSFMAPICLFLPLLAHIFMFHHMFPKRKSIKNYASGKNMRSRREKNQIANIQSLFMSEVTGRRVDWCTFRFHVNMPQHKLYPKEGACTYTSLSCPPSLRWRLKHVKVIRTERNTLQWQKKANYTAICWWYGDEHARRWKCKRRRQGARRREQCF